MGEFSRTSGGLYCQMGTMSFTEAFDSINESIMNTQVITIDCGSLRADGKTHELYVSVETGGKKFEGQLSGAPQYQHAGYRFSGDYRCDEQR